MKQGILLIIYLFLPLLDAQTLYYCSDTCVLDPRALVPDSNNGTLCSYNCPGGGQMQQACTTSTSTTTTTAAPTTTTTLMGTPITQYFCSDTCVIDLAVVAATSNDGSMCSYSCPGGGTMTQPCTSTTSTTTTSTTTTTAPTTVVATPITQYWCSDTCVIDLALKPANSNDGTVCSYSCPGGGTMTTPCTSTTSTTTAATTTSILIPSPMTQYYCSDTCVLDLSVAPATTNDGTVCSYSCPGGGTMTQPCTSTTSTTTVSTTTVGGICSPIVKDNGQQYDNKCVIVDAQARCDETANVTCTCSTGYSGVQCQVAADQLKKLEELMGGGPTAAADAQKMLEAIYESKGKGGAATLLANLPALLSFLSGEQRINMSYTASEVVIGATYEGKSLDQETDFTRITDPSLGNCFTFNHHNASMHYKIRRIGEGGGLRVELDSLPDEYAPWTDVVGMNVFVHPVGQELNVESNKYSSIAGSADQLVMKRSIFHKIKNKKCARDVHSAQSFYLAGTYTVDGCLRACYQDSVFKDCGCMDASYARKAGVPGCKFGKLLCIQKMIDRRGDPVHWDECHCPQPCDEETFDYVVSRATHLRIDNTNFTARRSEVILFFDSFQTKISTEVYKMSFSQVIGNIGGVAGLLLGINIAFIFEVIMLAVALCCCSKLTKQRDENEHRTA